MEIPLLEKMVFIFKPAPGSLSIKRIFLQDLPPQKDNNLEHIRISNAVSCGFIFVLNIINCDKVFVLT